MLIELCAGCARGQAEVAGALVKLARKGGGIEPMWPRTFHDNLPSPLQKGKQEDAHEYLRLLLERIHALVEPRGAHNGPEAKAPPDPVTAPTSQPSAPMAARSTPDSSGSTTTLVSSTPPPRSAFQLLLTGSYRSRITCLNCGGASDTYDDFADLSLDLAPSVLQALQGYTSVDTLAGSDSYLCSTCQTGTAATKQITLMQAPDILTIHLKRFDWEGNKVHTPVRFDTTLDLAPFLSTTDKKKKKKKKKEDPTRRRGEVPTGHSTEYELYALIHHFGPSVHRGHYVASVRVEMDPTTASRRRRQQQHRWWRMDDDRVVPHTLDLNDPSVYMLFYRRAPIRTVKTG